MYSTVHVEELNKPAAPLCTKGFELVAKLTASSRGMPGLRIVAETVPAECTVMEQARAAITPEIIDNLLKSATKPREVHSIGICNIGWFGENRQLLESPAKSG